MMNIIRESAVLTIHKKRSDMNIKLADQMCRRVSTSQKRYCITKREKTSVAASKAFANNMKNDPNACNAAAMFQRLIFI